jgi:hypothetical protein
VTNVLLHAEGSRVKGQGLLEITSEKLALHLEIGSKTAMPRRQKNIWKTEDFWSLSGTIEGDLRFSCYRVSPGRRTDHWKAESISRTVQVLHLSAIELQPDRWDKLTDAQKCKAIGLPSTKKHKFPKVIFKAVLVGCEQIFVNASTDTEIDNDFLGKRETSAADTFIDRANDYDFALIKEGEDLHVHFRSKAGFRSKNEQDDRRRFWALMTAISFTHGIHPSPFRLTYWRNGRKRFDQISSAQPVIKSPHAPFDDGLGRSVGRDRSGARKSPIRIAAKFFERQRALSPKLSHLLFVCRASTAESVDLRVRTLPLCSLFEGVVNLLFDHLKLEKELRKKDPRFDEYVRQRDRLCSRLKKFAAKNNSALRRLAGSLEHAKAFGVKHKFRALSDHFQLNRKEMSRHFESWKKRRNPLSHGEWDSSIEDFIHQSRIAGAINIFVLKLMGYSGRVRAVTLGEDTSETYRAI